jgi:hypothetical protein
VKNHSVGDFETGDMPSICTLLPSKLECVWHKGETVLNSDNLDIILEQICDWINNTLERNKFSQNYSRLQKIVLKQKAWLKLRVFTI